MLPRTRGLVIVVAVGFLSALAACPAIACVVGTGTSASCSEAVLDACLPGGGSFDGTVTFSCGGAATITVTGTKTIDANTTIDGGSVIIISGGNGWGVFAMNSGVTFTVENLTIANGFTALGGAIFNNSGTLIVTNSTVSGNSAFPGGGAIYNASGTVTAIVTNSTFSGNSGGAIGNASGTLTVTNSTFSGNNGAITNSGTLTVTNSTFSGNNGAIQNGSYAFDVGTATVTNSTFFSNSGYNPPGSWTRAIYNADGTLTVTNSILANSTSGGNCVVFPPGTGGVTIDGGHNIADDDGVACGLTGTGCTSTAGTSFCNTNPLLDPAGLANNGGLTQTIALQGGSPAIDAVPIAQCPSTDQRGAPRPDPGDSGGDRVRQRCLRVWGRCSDHDDNQYQHNNKYQHNNNDPLLERV